MKNDEVKILRHGLPEDKVEDGNNTCQDTDIYRIDDETIDDVLRSP